MNNEAAWDSRPAVGRPPVAILAGDSPTSSRKRDQNEPKLEKPREHTRGAPQHVGRPIKSVLDEWDTCANRSTANAVCLPGSEARLDGPRRATVVRLGLGRQVDADVTQVVSAPTRMRRVSRARR
jgi:hypothetical protein